MLLLAALVVGIVVAVEVHHLTTPADPFGSLRPAAVADTRGASPAVTPG